MLPLAGVFFVHVTLGGGGRCCRNIGFGHVLFIETDNSLLKFFVVSDLTEHFINVILKLALVLLLGHDTLSEGSTLKRQTLHFSL